MNLTLIKGEKPDCNDCDDNNWGFKCATHVNWDLFPSSKPLTHADLERMFLHTQGKSYVRLIVDNDTGQVYD